jgi:hypothetical protein
MPRIPSLAILLACLWALPAAAEEMGSFSLSVQNGGGQEIVVTLGGRKPAALAPGKSVSFSRAYDEDDLARSPTYQFEAVLSDAGGTLLCHPRLKVEVSAWGEDYIFSCFPRRELSGPCLITCDYDNISPNSTAKVVYRPGP